MAQQHIEPSLGELPSVDHAFFLRQGNRSFARGKSKRLARPSIRIIDLFLIPLLALVLLILTVVIIYLARNSLPNGIRLIFEDARTQGEVIGRRRNTRGSGYQIQYHYEVDGITYSARDAVSRFNADEFQIGDVSEVRYLPDEPHLSELVNPVEDIIEWVFSALMLIIMLPIFGVGIVQAIRDGIRKARKRQRRLQRLEQKGSVLPGRVVSVAVRQARRDAWHKRLAFLEYEFTSPKGHTIRKKSEYPVSPFFTPPEPDTPLFVIYVNDRLYEVL